MKSVVAMGKGVDRVRSAVGAEGVSLCTQRNTFESLTRRRNLVVMKKKESLSKRRRSRRYFKRVDGGVEVMLQSCSCQPAALPYATQGNYIQHTTGVAQGSTAGSQCPHVTVPPQLYSTNDHYSRYNVTRINL